MPKHYFTGHRDIPDPLEQYMPRREKVEFDGVLQLTINREKVKASDFMLPMHRSMYQFWLAHKKGDELPPSTAIDPLSFQDAIGFVHVIEPNEDATDFKYRVFASQVSHILELDMTGKWFSESPVPRWAFYRRQLAAVVALRAPVYSENNADYVALDTIHWCRLLLPLVNEQESIDRILAVNAPLDRPAAAP